MPAAEKIRLFKSAGDLAGFLKKPEVTLELEGHEGAGAVPVAVLEKFLQGNFVPALLTFSHCRVLGIYGVPASTDLRVPFFTVRTTKFLREFAVFEEGDKTRFSYEVAHDPKAAPEEDFEGALYAGPGELSNHYHFLFDCFGRAAIFYALRGALPEKLAFHSSGALPAGVVPWLAAIYGLCGSAPPEVKTIAAKSLRAAACANLLVARSPTIHLEQFSPVMLRFYRAIGQRCVDPAKTRKLYISRARAAKRRVVQEEALAGALAERGFTKVHLEDLKPIEQIELFANASFVVSPHGAGLANLLFSIDCRGLIEVLPQHYAFTSPYGLLASDLHIRYQAVESRPAADATQAVSADPSDLHVDVVQLLSLVARMEDRLV